MSRGLQYSVAYTYGKTIDWWAGTIPQPEYWYLNKGETGAAAHAQHVGDLRAAIRQRQEIPDGGRPVPHLRRMADQRVLQRAIRRAVQRHRQQCVAQCGRWHQPARRSGQRRRGDLWLRERRRVFRRAGVQAGDGGPLWHRGGEFAARARLGESRHEPLPHLWARRRT